MVDREIRVRTVSCIIILKKQDEVESIFPLLFQGFIYNIRKFGVPVFVLFVCFCHKSFFIRKFSLKFANESIDNVLNKNIPEALRRTIYFSPLYRFLNPEILNYIISYIESQCM